MKHPSKKRCILVVLCLIVIAMIIGILWGNSALKVTEFQVESHRIPEEFSGFRIVHISDLHNTEFGENNARLIKRICSANPDIIVITGDLIDSRRTNIEVALAFVQQAVKICPVYYVNGNHESRISEYDTLKFGMIEAGATVLENKTVQISKEEAHITLMGIDDPSFRVNYLTGDEKTVIRQEIEELDTERNEFTVLLSHRPECFDTYVELDIDLIFSGHAHGGQFRLPFIGGLVAPNQGFFPTYDAGKFTKNHTTMIVSRGIGNSIVPVRVNNPPEIVVAELKSVN